MRSHYSYRRNTDEEYRASNLELFFDLVFVFAITQVSHLLLDHLTWKGALESTMVLLAVWSAWNYTTWATNELDPDATPIRLVLMAIMMACLLMSVAIPEAFGAQGLLFAAAYVFIQVGRTGFLTFGAAEPGTIERRRALHIFIWFCFSGIFWIAGALFDGDARILIWLIALFIDYAGPFVTYRVPGLENVTADSWEVGGTHLAERFQLFTIIALGETIVLTGATTSGIHLDLAVVAAFSFAFLSTVTLWWLYFNYVATVFERLLVEAENKTLAARDLYTYGHIPIIAGIILCAVGDEIVIAHPTHHLETAALVAVVAGPVLYLLSFVPARYLNTGGLPVKRVVGAVCCLVVGAVAAVAELPAMAVGGLLVAVLISVVLRESYNPSRPASIQ